MSSERAEEIFKKIESGKIRALDDFIGESKTEELFLDFKTVSQEYDGRTLGESQHKNLSKAISGFGNSSGGVIVWGIDCSSRKDVASQKKPFSNPDKFCALLEDAVGGKTNPAHRGVRSITLKGNPSDTEGFAATLIPASDDAPLRAIHPGLDKYFIRSGSTFSSVSHEVLAGLFGRRPSPRVVMRFGQIEVRGPENIILNILLKNAGRAIARDFFITASWKSKPTQKCLFLSLGDTEWQNTSYGGMVTRVARGDLKLPPGSVCLALTISLHLQQDPSSILEFDLRAGCDGGPTVIHSIESSLPQLREAIVLAEDISRSPNHAGYQRHFIETVFGGTALERE